eukprot:g2819.t1
MSTSLHRTAKLWGGKESEHILPGHRVSVRDEGGIWREAVVLRGDAKTVGVHYCGWSSQFDENIEVSSVKERIRALNSDWRSKIAENSRVEVLMDVSNQRRFWHAGIVSAVAGESVRVRYANTKVFRWIERYSDELCSMNTHVKLATADSNRPKRKRKDDVDDSESHRKRMSSLSSKTERPRGLKNPQNLCYVNAVLQVIANATVIKARPLDEGSDRGREETSSAGGEIIHAFEKLLVGGMNKSVNALVNFTAPIQILRKKYMSAFQGSLLSATEIKSALSRRHEQFCNSDQQDAHEFMQCFLDTLHADQSSVPLALDVAETAQKLSQEDIANAKSYWDMYIRRTGQSPITERCTGLLRSDLKCPNCGASRTCFEPFVILPIPLTAAKDDKKRGSSTLTLESCLGRFLGIEETLRREDSWRCCECQHLVQATKTTTMCMAPTYLIVCLKRFRSDKVRGRRVSSSSRRPRSIARKIKSRVDFPLRDLDLSSYFRGNDDVSTKLPLSYDLCGAIHHTGTLRRGHYTASVKVGPAGSWFRCDDERVSAIRESDIVSPSAYILMYRRRE